MLLGFQIPGSIFFTRIVDVCQPDIQNHPGGKTNHHSDTGKIGLFADLRAQK